MNHAFRTTLLAVTAIAACAVPALAESTVCSVNTEIRVRQSPSKKAKVLTVLKKNAQVTADKSCAGGWVKVASQDGKLTGYVGGWALSPLETTVVEATASPVAETTAAPVTETTAAPAYRETPSNEKLAMQITELRLNVLGIERDMQQMGKEIRKIKVALRRKTASAK